jgi:hypothetical protein
MGCAGGRVREVPHNEAVIPLKMLALPAAATVAIALASCSGSTTSTSNRGSSHSGGSPGSSSTPSPGSSVPAQGTGCVSHDEAVRIWTEIDQKLNAVELDPKHAGVTDVATGQALQLINEYLQMQLVSSNFTEKEVDKLESLSIVDAGCNGGDLQVTVSEKVVQDDYLKPNGQVDHADPAVGTTLQLAETFTRSGGTWKESDFRDMSSPTSTPQLF